MNKVNYVIAFILGAGTGVAGSYAYFKNKYDKKANEEINAIICDYENMIKDMFSDDEDEKNAEPVEMAAVDEEEVKDYEVRTSIYAPSRDEVIDIGESDDQEIEVIDISDNVTERVGLSVEDHPLEDGPYMIDEVTYSESELDYDKEVLQFFTDDRVLYDPTVESVCLNITNMIGEDGLDLVACSDDSTVYFRNELYGIDYEVVKIAGSFYE